MKQSFKTKSELRDRVITDTAYFLSLCQVNDYAGTGLVPFELNPAQRRYHDEVVRRGVDRDIVAKSRKWGFSTYRLGEQLHGVLYRPGRIGRTVAQRWDTTKQLGDIVKLLYRTAWNFFEAISGATGVGPEYFMPVDKSGDRRIIDLGSGKGKLYVETAGGRAVGQADRTDDLYCTEYADWEHAEDAYNGLEGSIPLGNPGARLTIDFNANETWMGSDCYVKWEGANKTGEDWNSFTPFFSGVLDLPERYPETELAKKRGAMGTRYPLSYPETVEDLYKQRDRCVFNVEDLKACMYADYAQGCREHLVGADTSTGMPDGDYQVAIVLGWTGERWHQVCPAIRERVPEDVFAGHVDEVSRRYPGVTVVEANVGSAVLVRLKELNTPGLYKHRHRDKDGRQTYKLGFQTTYASKRIQLSQLQRMFKEGTIGIVEDWLFEELRDFEWKDGWHLAGAPDRSGAFDDGVAALWCAEAGQHYEYADLGVA